MKYYPPVSPYASGLGCKCPRCGQGALFRSFLALNGDCAACGLDFASADAGDGPAVFVIFLVGFVSVAVAFIVRFAFFAPTALAFGVSAAIAIILILALLRPMKATFIALQYRNKAEEGRLK